MSHKKLRGFALYRNEDYGGVVSTLSFLIRIFGFANPSRNEITFVRERFTPSMCEFLVQNWILSDSKMDTEHRMKKQKDILVFSFSIVIINVTFLLSSQKILSQIVFCCHPIFIEKIRIFFK